MNRVLQCVAMSFVIHQPSDEMCRKGGKDIALKSRGKRRHKLYQDTKSNK